MYIDLSSINFILVVVAVFWLLFISVFAISLVMGDRSDQKISKGFEHLKEDLERKTSIFLEEAHANSRRVVEDALARSATMENDTRRILGSNHDQFTQELHKLSNHQIETLQKTSEDLIKAYQDAVESERGNIIKNFHNTTEQVKQTLLIDFDKFKQDLDARTLEAQKQLDAKVEEAYKKMKDDIESYKADRVTKLENTIAKTLQDVATKVFGKVLSIQDHEELVLRALEEAKRENGLKK